MDKVTEASKLVQLIESFHQLSIEKQAYILGYIACMAQDGQKLPEKKGA